MAEHAATGGGGVEVIQRIPIIHAAKKSLLQWDVEILVRTKTIATVALPGFVAEHSLPAKEIIGGSGIICVKALLLAIVELRVEKKKRSVRVTTRKLARGGKSTKGMPGMTSDVMKVASALLCVPLSKLGQRNTSKLLVPNKCFGSS